MRQPKVKGQSGPLTERHLEVLNTLLAACHETLQFCGACKDCHLDVEQEIAKTKEQQEIASRIKARFFPTAR